MSIQPNVPAMKSGLLIAALLPVGLSLHAATYDITDLGALGGSQSAAYGINASGRAVGSAFLTDNTANAAVLFSTGGNIEIGNFGGINVNEARGINASGAIVGINALPGDTSTHAFIYLGGATINLGTLGGTSSRAYAINDNDQVVGTSNLAVGGVTYHAFIYQGGQMTDLNTLIPENSGWVLATAYAINANGQIAGSGTLNGVNRAFLLTPAGNGTGSSMDAPRIYVNGAKRPATTGAEIKLSGSSGGAVAEVRCRLDSKGACRGTNGPASS